MDKFLAGNSVAPRGGDLLKALQDRKGTQAGKSVTQSHSEWSAYESKHLSSVDIACQQTLKSIQARNYVGWKTDENGKRVYTTFRNGKKVQVDGQEAFKLAMADGKIKPTASEDGSERRGSTDRKRKVQEIEVYSEEVVSTSRDIPIIKFFQQSQSVDNKVAAKSSSSSKSAKTFSSSGKDIDIIEIL
jgi:hypothetical protein